MVYGPYRATVVAIHDGDTLDVDILLAKAGKSKTDVDLGFNVHRHPRGTMLERQSVRLYGCNAPELATADGKAARDYLASLVKVGDIVRLLSHGWDKYGGRIDGQITLTDGTDLAQAMIAAGHAAPWDGKGPKPVPAAA